jgi:hypothetical protein
MAIMMHVTALDDQETLIIAICARNERQDLGIRALAQLRRAQQKQAKKMQCI